MSAGRLRVVITTTLVAATLACGRDEPRVLTIPIDGRPSAVAGGAGIIWVADDEHHVVHMIRASDGELIDDIAVARNPIALAAGAGYVWVAHAGGAVVPIGLTSRDARDPIEVGGSLTGIEFLDGRVWVANLPEDEIVAIDAPRRRVTRRIEVPAGVVRLTRSGDHLWVSGRENQITRVDPGSRIVHDPVDVGSGPIGLVSDGERVWVANSDDGTVSVVDDDGGRVTRTIEAGRAPVDVATGPDGSVWVANQDDATLTAVGSGTSETVAVGIKPRDVTVFEEAIWTVGNSDVPNSNALVRVLP